MTSPRPVPQLAWPADAELTMPGSKSAANRLLVAAAASGRPVRVSGVTASDDVRHLIDGLRTLGFAVAHDTAAGTVDVGPRSADAPTRGTIDCGNGGTTLRFLLSLAAITPGEWVLTGDAAMQRRPVGPLVAAWRQLDVDVRDTNGCPPVRVRGGHATGGAVTLDASRSSQFVSSLLLVAPALRDGLAVTFAGRVASREYLAMTQAALARFGARCKTTRDGVRVPAGFAAVPATVATEGDWSSMGVWTCLAHLTGSRVRASNLVTGSGQPDEALAAGLAAWPQHGDHTVDVAAMPDQFMNLAIVAAHRAGTTRFVGGANLRHKESDRIAVMARELQRIGVPAHETPDGLVVTGGAPLRPATIDPANDHRVAMAFALAGLLAPGLTIATPDCVTKSYPAFWDDLATIVAQRRCVAVVGMRGAGKSTFARAFAARTGSRCIDSDDAFVQQHGPIDAFVASHGWPAFRREEERVVVSALRPGHVVSLGGGAVETAAVRDALGTDALVVWLTADTTLLRMRLQHDATTRPSVTGAPVLDELETLRQRREPLYASLAHVRLDGAATTDRQIDEALAALGRPCRWPGGGVGA